MAVKGSGAGGGASAGAIRAGRAFVELGTEDSSLRRGLVRAQQMIRQFGAMMAKAGAGLSLAGGGILGGLTPLLRSAVGKTSRLSDASEMFSLTADQVSRMSHAFGVAGESTDTLVTALTKLAQANTSNMPLDAFASQTARELLAIEDGSERARRGVELFSRGWFKIANALKDFDALSKEAPLFSKEALQAAEDFEKSSNRIGLNLQAGLLPLVQLLEPAVRGVADFTRANQELLPAVFGVGVGLTALGAALVATGAVVSAMAGILSAIVSPLGLATAATAALTIAFLTLTEDGRAITSEAGSLFQTLGRDFAATWGGVQDSLRSGNLQLAADIALKGLELSFARTTDAINMGWLESAKFFSQVWNQATDDASDHFLNAAEAIFGAKVAGGNSFGELIAVAAQGSPMLGGSLTQPLAWLLDQVNPVSTTGGVASFDEVRAQLAAMKKSEESQIDAEFATEVADQKRRLAGLETELRALLDKARLGGLETAPMPRLTKVANALAAPVAAMGAFGAADWSRLFSGAGDKHLKAAEQSRDYLKSIDKKVGDLELGRFT